MPNKKDEDIKIIMKNGKVVTRRDLFKKKEDFHKEQAKLPFEEKIKILVNLQKIANSIKRSKEKQEMIWKMSSESVLSRLKP